MAIITSLEAMRQQGGRLEIYRLAVEAGFYNESPNTIPYKGYLFMPDESLWCIVQHGTILMRMNNLHAARIWVTCRVQKVGLIEANRIVGAE